ncbi:hypothetical protein [Mycolicibacterium fortuitum]|uniref:hypothetical protein n=1 Tax=Mycolicibacterium fortuitum TaxID=1766 RepID=UPI0026383911|nr:hypothetical protein [Mycolicibacterium fortuitum]
MSATSDLLAQLERHYIKPSAPMPGGIFLPEVGQNGGWGSGSRADAIYVGFTSSSGRILVGHELKISRSDWLNELNKPGKADAWADQCHEWWLVVTDPGIVHPGELPADWGLMSPSPRSRNRMQIHTRAVRKDPAVHRPSWDAVRSIMAREDTLRAQAIERARADAYRAATAEVNERVEQRIKNELTQSEHNDATIRLLRERLRAVDNALGNQILWDRNKIAGFANQTTTDEIAQIRTVLKETGSVKASVRRLSGISHKYQLDDLQRAIDIMRDALAGLEEVPR